MKTVLFWLLNLQVYRWCGNSQGQTTVFVLYFPQASGGRDKIIHIWDPDSLQHVHTFKGHKDAVSVSLTYYCLKHCSFYKTWLLIKLFHVSSLFFSQGLAFRRGTHQLFSCSHDRTAKIWNLDEMAYVETL